MAASTARQWRKRLWSVTYSLRSVTASTRFIVAPPTPHGRAAEVVPLAENLNHGDPPSDGLLPGNAVSRQAIHSGAEEWARHPTRQKTHRRLLPSSLRCGGQRLPVVQPRETRGFGAGRASPGPTG